MATDTHFDVNSLLQVRYPGTWKSARNSQCLSKVPVGICDRGRATACMCVLWLEHHSLIHRKITKKFLKLHLKIHGTVLVITGRLCTSVCHMYNKILLYFVRTNHIHTYTNIHTQMSFK